MLNLDDLFKAARPDAPARGGKYIRREWTGDRWRYWYADSPSASHGPGAVRDLNDPMFSHSLEVTTADLHENPEEAYKNALAKALKDPKQSHPVANPQGGEPWSLKLTIKGKKATLTVHDDKGEVVKEGLASRGAYEMWYLGTAHSQSFHDHTGEAYMDLMPNVGQVKDGELVPSGDKNRAWVVRMNKEYCEKHGVKFEKWPYPTRELAEKHIQKALRNKHVSEGGGDVRTSLEHLDPEERDAIKSAMAEGGSMHAPPGSVADKIQSGKLKYRMKDAKHKELDLDPVEKQKLIAQAAKEYWPFALGTASRMANHQFFKEDDRPKREWMERFLGTPLPDHDFEKEADGRPKVVAMDPDSAYYQAIETALDNYDPAHGVGFSGYAAGKKGRIWSRMYNWQDNFIKEMKGTSSGKSGDDDGGSVNYGDIKGATEDQAESSAAYQTPEEVHDAHTEWHNSTMQLLNAWEDAAPNDRAGTREQFRTVINQIRSLSPDQRLDAARDISQMLLDMGIHKYVQKAIKWHQAVHLMKALQRPQVRA